MRDEPHHPLRTSPVGAAGRSAALRLVFLLAGTALACDDPAGPALSGGSDRIEVSLGSEPSDYPLDPWELVDGGIEGDTLRLDVRYGGGCVEHDFGLAAIGAWVDLPTFGPTPTRAVPVLLAHDDHDDACDAVVSITLRFGLEPLRDAYRERYGSGPVRLLLRVTDGRSDPPIAIYDWFLP